MRLITRHPGLLGLRALQSWAQRGAIFKQAPHKAGAKLFLSWMNSQTTQKNAIATWTWSVRKGIDPGDPDNTLGRTPGAF